MCSYDITIIPRYGKPSRQPAEPQQPQIATIGGKEYFGNTAGLGIIETIEQLKIDVRDQNNRICEQGDQISTLKYAVKCLNQDSLSYRKIRHRFLTDYIRTRDSIRSIKHTTVIRANNLAAHGGNALVDAYIFRDQEWDDDEVFEELYRLRFLKVLRFGM